MDNYELLYAHRGGGAGTPEDLHRHLLRYGVRYLVLSPMTGFTEAGPFERVLADVEDRCPGAFAIRYRDPDPRYRILEVDAAKLADAGCAILGKETANTRERHPGPTGRPTTPHCADRSQIHRSSACSPAGRKPPPSCALLRRRMA